MSSPNSYATLPPRTVVLRDGKHYVVRPLGPTDARLVSEMFGTLSADSIQARYGYLIHDMTPERAHRLVYTDDARDFSLGLIERTPAGDHLWAIGRLVHAPDNRSAECAFLVHDAKRRLGIASVLLKYLRIVGRRRGIPRLFAQVRRDNKGMLEVFRRINSRLHFDPGGDVVEIDIPVRGSKILFDNPQPADFAARMASPVKKGFSVGLLIIDLILVAAFFVFFYYVLQSHVPSRDATMVRLWATLGSACMTGVFWLALQMVRTVFRFQRDGRR
jgi:GNAT superfamily N-acetyltransferase